QLCVFDKAIMSGLNRRVKLNVGGQIFETTVGTLCRVPNTRLSRLVDNIDRLNDGSEIFIDHDPKYFPMVLNFLRDGRIPLPDNITEIDQLRWEAQYFELSALTDFIESEEQRGPPFFRGDKVIWRDQNFQRALSKAGWHFDGSTGESVKPLCFMPRSDETRTCGICGVSTDSFDRNYRTIFELPRNATFAIGEVRKVYRDSCCVDVTFAMFNYLYHIPAKMLQLVGNFYTSIEE
ncbi:K+ channel tetramerization domain protein, partial [Teladorsagia circumcincta]